MATTIVLFVLLGVASVLDVWQVTIRNWLTYSGILAALAANLAAWWFQFQLPAGVDPLDDRWGLVGMPDSLIGFLACGGVMLVCYVFFASELGGGDVKLIAMLGAWLGIYQGLETMLWTFVIAACVALIMLVWRYGAVRIVSQVARHGWRAVKLGQVALNEEERKPLKTLLPFAPSALAALTIVRWHLIEWF